VTAVAWPLWSINEPSTLSRYVVTDVAEQVPLSIVRDDAISAGQRAAVVRAIYESLSKRDLQYSREAWAPRDGPQRIRDPESISRGGNATCLDLSVLFAGACLGHELLPLVVVVEGHSFVVVSLLDDPRFPDSRSRIQRDGDWVMTGVLHSADVFARLVAEKTGHYLAVECTGFARTERSGGSVPALGRAESGTLPFQAAVDAARAHCLDPFLFAVDPAVLQRVKLIPQYDRFINDEQIDTSRDSQTATIVGGRAALTLDQVHLYSIHDQPRNEFEFLLTNLRATQIVGRTADIATLKTWLSEPSNVSVRCLTGSAGTGKTRLAIELCQEASKGGDGLESRWVSGFVSHEELQRFTESQESKTWKWLVPTLVVVDDVGACARSLRSWLLELCRRTPNPHGPRLRLLLLERQADPAFGWWKELFGPVGTVERSPARLLSPRVPVDLFGINSADDRHRLLKQVIHAVAKFRDVAQASEIPATDPKSLTRIVEKPESTEPLYLIMAGIVAVMESAELAVSLAAYELAKHIAESEAQRVKKIASARAVSEEFAMHLVVCVTLQGGCDLADLKRIIREERLIAHQETAPEETILTVLAEALPSVRRTTRLAEPLMVDAIRPDLVGEALLLNEISRPFRTEPDQFDLIERAWRRKPDKVRETLLNISADFWRDESDSLVNKWIEQVAKLVLDDLTRRLENGQIDPNNAVDEIWHSSFTTLDWFKLTTLIVPFIDRLEPTRLGQFASLRAVSYVEGARYKSGVNFSEEILQHPAFPQSYRPELLNVKGRCLFHMRQYKLAADPYQAGIDAAGPGGPLVDQLYINLGNALLEDYQHNKRPVFASALKALKMGVELASDPRLRVESRACLSNALIIDGQFNAADGVLQEAWSIAGDVRSVPNKARMMVLRNRAIISIALGNLKLGVKRFDAAVEYGKASFGPYHAELVDLYESRYRYLVATSKKPHEIIKEMLEVWADMQSMRESVDRFPLQKFHYLANGVAEIAMNRLSLRNRALLITSLIEQGANQGWSPSSIKSVTDLFRR
jgi:tetratricopeptide (TPR) repeat protein